MFWLLLGRTTAALKFSDPRPSVFICGPILRAIVRSPTLPYLNPIRTQSLRTSAPSPSSPAPAYFKRSSRLARPIVSSLVESASAKPVRAKRTSRPGNIEKRAGHGRESILWLIRTSREWRKVTVKGNRRARLTVDSYTFSETGVRTGASACAD